MTPSVVILGFERDYSNQIRELLEISGSVGTVHIQDDAVSPVPDRLDDINLTDGDIALLNGSNPDSPGWLRSYLKQHDIRPPNSLVIGNQPSPDPWHGSDRRMATRLYLPGNEVTSSRLTRAIKELSDNSPAAAVTVASQSTGLTRLDDEKHSKQAFQLFTEQEIRQHPTYVGKYRLTRLIGKGGMATVYEAVNTEAEKLALKVLDPDAITDDRLLDRFIEEYELIATVKHPHVIRVYEQGFTDQHIYIAMQLLKPHSLKSRILDGLSKQQSVQYAMDICDALGKIHDMGILHRDIKPDNLLFDQAERIVLTDFGLAKDTVDMESMALTGEGEAVGTPSYMSPELLLGESLSIPSDLYSLGILFYRMLTGHLPFQSRSPVVLMHHHIESRPPDLPASMSELNPLIQRLLAKQPADRFQSAHEVREALSKII